MKTRYPGDVDCTCYRLRQAARLVSRTYDSFLAPCGISIGQFGMLATLAAMNGESISKLADALQIERTTLSRNLLRSLEKQLGRLEAKMLNQTLDDTLKRLPNV